MFFRKDYAAPGPGIRPDEPEKTGMARFVQILELECVTLVKLNLLFLVSCLPVVTIPPALFAMNQVVRRMVLDQPVDCFYHYRKAFRKYWKQGYAAFLLTAVPLVFSGVGMWFYLSRVGSSVLFFLPFTLCSTVFLVTLLASVCFYGLLSLDWSIPRALKLSIPLGLGRPARAVLAVLCYYVPMVFAVLAFPISALYLLLIGFSVPCLLGNFYLRTELKRYGGGGDLHS